MEQESIRWGALRALARAGACAPLGLSRSSVISIAARLVRSHTRSRTPAMLTQAYVRADCIRIDTSTDTIILRCRPPPLRIDDGGSHCYELPWCVRSAMATSCYDCLIFLSKMLLPWCVHRPRAMGSEQERKTAAAATSSCGRCRQLVAAADSSVYVRAELRQLRHYRTSRAERVRRRERALISSYAFFCSTWHVSRQGCTEAALQPSST